MAPEVLDQPYDERSDVWSVGCIALEMVTCALFDDAEIIGKLVQIKHNDAILQDVLSKVNNVSEILSCYITVNCNVVDLFHKLTRII